MIKINGKPYEIKFFPDGTLNMNHSFIQRHDDYSKVYIQWNFENLTEQVVIQNLAMFIKDVLCADIELELPYVPNARQDRVKNPEQEIHTLKYFIEWLNWLGFRQVIVTDVHSPVTMTLLHHGYEQGIASNIIDVLDKIGAEFIFFPDEGAFKRYDYLHEHISFTPFYGEKTRNWSDGKIIGYEIRNPYNLYPIQYKDEPVLIVDDISSYGTTFDFAANALAAAGFGAIYLYITHCENSILHGKVIDNPLVQKIFTTNSIFTGKHEKIMII